MGGGSKGGGCWDKSARRGALLARWSAGSASWQAPAPRLLQQRQRRSKRGRSCACLDSCSTWQVSGWPNHLPPPPPPPPPSLLQQDACLGSSADVSTFAHSQTQRLPPGGSVSRPPLAVLTTSRPPHTAPPCLQGGRRCAACQAPSIGPGRPLRTPSALCCAAWRSSCCRACQASSWTQCWAFPSKPCLSCQLCSPAAARATESEGRRRQLSSSGGGHWTLEQTLPPVLRRQRLLLLVAQQLQLGQRCVATWRKQPWSCCCHDTCNAREQRAGRAVGSHSAAGVLMEGGQAVLACPCAQQERFGIQLCDLLAESFLASPGLESWAAGEFGQRIVDAINAGGGEGTQIVLRRPGKERQAPAAGEAQEGQQRQHRPHLPAPQEAHLQVHASVCLQPALGHSALWSSPCAPAAEAVPGAGELAVPALSPEAAASAAWRAQRLRGGSPPPPPPPPRRPAGGWFCRAQAAHKCRSYLPRTGACAQPCLWPDTSIIYPQMCGP